MGEENNPRLWVKIVLPGGGQIGPGKVALLKAVRETGSISAAARAMSISYKKAWELIDQLNGMFVEPAVETRIGGSERGGAKLTTFGARVIAIYEEASQAADAANAELLRELKTAANRSI